MLNENFVYLGLILASLGGLIYFFDTVKGKTKPNKVTWFIWGIAPLVAFFAAIEQGVGVQSLFMLVLGAEPILILIASFLNKNAYWKITPFDFLCGALAIVGLILWKITGTGNIAILLSIIADAFAAAPTLIKSFYAPETETSYSYLGSGLAALITLLTIKTWGFEYFAFPLYIFIVCAIIYSLIQFKLGKKILKKLGANNINNRNY